MSVLVSVPTSPADPYIHKRLAMVLPWFRQEGVKLIFPSHNPLENNLHHIRRQLLREKHDYWLNIDSDNPPIRNPLELVPLDKDLIGFPTPVWHYDEENKEKGERPYYWNAYLRVEGGYKEWPIKDGLQRVDAAGGGCFLVARRVMEVIEQPFVRKLYPDGRVERGNDISFCERAVEQGFKIYAHYDYPCMHFNELELTEVIRAFRNLYE